MLKLLSIILIFLFLSACADKLDTEPPVITLIGDNSISVTQGTIYHEAGATVTDNLDTTILLKIDNPINTSIVGTYIVTYTAVDIAKNEAIPVRRTVTVTSTISIIVAQGMTSLIALRSNNELPAANYTFSLINTPTKGLVDLQANQIFLSYTATSAIGEDMFDYKITTNNDESYIITVAIKIIPKKVELNGVLLPDFSSNLPLVILDTLYQVPDNPKINGLLTIIPQNQSTGRSYLHNKPQYKGLMEIEKRGSSSQKFPKKQYAVDTLNFKGDDKNVSLLGMPKEHKWILHAPYSDKSLMRNYLAYNKTREMGGYTAVRSKYVEVLRRQDNGIYHYEGVYLLMEKIKRDKNRVNISKLKPLETKPSDITGGYILRQDREKTDWFFFTKRKSKIVLEYPKTKNINQEQKEYIENYINDFEDALYSDSFNDTQHNNYYGNFINTDSYIKHLLSREFFRDADTWLLSEYFTKDKGGKLSMSPVWDFNLSMGNSNRTLSVVTTGWSFNRFANDRTGVAGVMKRLMSDAKFKSKVASTWHSLRDNEWSDPNLELFIENTKNLLNESQERNFQRWPILGKYVWPNRKNVCSGSTYCDAWDKAVDEHMKGWLIERAIWMDENLPL